MPEATAKATHTPGPWKIQGGCVVAGWSELREVEREDGVVVDHPSGLIALVYGCSPQGADGLPDFDSTGGYNGEANMALIADAPALLDALQALRVDLVVGGPTSAALPRAEALLRKHGRLP